MRANNVIYEDGLIASLSPYHPKPFFFFFFTIRMVTIKCKFNHNTFLLKILHLLSITFRISGYANFIFREFGDLIVQAYNFLSTFMKSKNFCKHC